MSKRRSVPDRVNADIVRDVAAGEASFSTLDDDERTVAHAIIDAGIAERAAEHRFGPDARAAGNPTVALDEDGSVIEIAPDGERTRR